ncbi:hypothetical protein KSS87_003960 [Heliosperma pusillum]|nr:hypothetical protein KSS87_003960 [Heliosperma pusillum]
MQTGSSCGFRLNIVELELLSSNASSMQDDVVGVDLLNVLNPHDWACLEGGNCRGLNHTLSLAIYKLLVEKYNTVCLGYSCSSIVNQKALVDLPSSGVVRILVMDKVITKENEELSVSGVDDVLDILKSDYDNAYFVTGIFSSSIYDADCLFEDPTIKFRGTKLYSRNIQLLVPFFEQPSIVLKNIEKGVNSDRDFVLATWSLRTYLKLPWRPLIGVEGSTTYDLNYEYKIVRHVESWNISALEAVGQIFTPGSRRPSK